MPEIKLLSVFVYSLCYYLLLIIASVVTSLDTRHQNSCFHKAQIKVTGQGRNAPVSAPVGMHYYIMNTSYKLRFFLFIFFLRHFLSVKVIFMYFYPSPPLISLLASPPTKLLHVLQVQPGELRACELDL